MAKTHAKDRKDAFWLHTIEKNVHESLSDFTLSNKMRTRLRTTARYRQKPRNMPHAPSNDCALSSKTAQYAAYAFERLRTIVKNAQKAARAFIILSEYGESKDLYTGESERVRLTIQASPFCIAESVLASF